MEKSLKPNFWKHLQSWLQKHHKTVYIVCAILVVLGSALGVFLFLNKKAAAPKPVAAIVKAPVVKPATKYYSPLTGTLVADQAATTQPVTAVMIENSPDARPQSGIKNSGLVFEAIAEGGITRFMVLYQQEKPQMIGPVRSLRIYDAEWLAAFNSGIAHVGGSAAALVEVRNGSYRDLDQFFNSGSYWRSSDRYSPHNVYTSFAKLDALNAAKGFTSSSFTGFTRTDGAPSAAPNATQVAVHISGPTYDSTYAYDKTTNTYARNQAGAAHLDREDGQITPSVVVAIRVDETRILQDGYREQITTIGSGSATIFQNGIAQAVTWHKNSKAEQMTFTDATTGKNAPLVRGQTWIVAVPNDSGSVTWQ